MMYIVHFNLVLNSDLAKGLGLWFVLPIPGFPSLEPLGSVCTPPFSFSPIRYIPIASERGLFSQASTLLYNVPI